MGTVRQTGPEDEIAPRLQEAITTLLRVIDGIEVCYGSAVALNAALSAYLNAALRRDEGETATEVLRLTVKSMPATIARFRASSCAGSA